MGVVLVPSGLNLVDTMISGRFAFPSSTMYNSDHILGDGSEWVDWTRGLVGLEERSNTGQRALLSSTAGSAQLPDVGDQSWADRFQVARGGMEIQEERQPINALRASSDSDRHPKDLD